MTNFKPNQKANTNLKPKIKSALRQLGGSATRKDIGKAMHLRREDRPEFDRIIAGMLAKGELREQEERLTLTGPADQQVRATIVKVNPTFGFAHPDEAEEDVFIAGRRMMGAMPGDVVLLRLRKDRDGRTEGEVVRILEEADFIFTGVVQRNGNFLDVMPDKGARFAIGVSKSEGLKPQEGHKVRCQLIRGGLSHFDHKARILDDFGSAELAKNCTAAIIAASGAPVEFSPECLSEAAAIDRAGIHEKEKAQRLDLRDRIIFTIDSADTKDIDDAISLTRTETGYELGVHIADVSYYVTEGSAIDRDAYERGTSIYYASSVIPMLPKELSNGICSLNEGEDRLAFSALMQLDHEGSLVSYRFEKTLIRSAVKGVYSEINALFDGSADEAIRKKYDRVLPTLMEMRPLYEKLIRNRDARGGLDLESSESKIVLDQNGVAVDILPRHSGLSENMIEEFMLLANTAAASFGIEHELPFLFRVHDKPPADKVEIFEQSMSEIGFDISELKKGVTQMALQHILLKARGTKYELIVNNSILRVMAKALYSSQNIGHFGLVIDKYSHFTSPIRRYPDLLIHRIMTAYLTGMRRENIEKRFRDFVVEAADRTSQQEIRAMGIERDCEDCYKAEYMKQFLGEELDGIISSIAPHGVYVELPNTVEGLIRMDDMPEGEYSTDSRVILQNAATGRTYTVGDPMKVQVVACDVSAGNVDFIPAGTVRKPRPERRPAPRGGNSSRGGSGSRGGNGSRGGARRGR